MCEKLPAYWRKLLERLAEHDPNIGSYSEDVPPGDIKCDGSNPTNVWFLAQSFAFEPEVTRDCTAPAKTQIFFPVAKITCSEAFDDEGDLHKCAKDNMDLRLAGENESYAKVDGKAVKIQRAASELFTLTLPEGNPVGKVGEYSAATDGLWVLLPSLPKGEHEVEIVSAFKDTPCCGDLPTRKRTYNLTVE